jgi:signal transduction histidine kinase/ligand-binding sensor domain-containing protein
MQTRLFFLIAYTLCTAASCLAQKYPFVHYSSKDGLLSNRVRNTYQDSKGRLYFSTLSGLSVYDGARFINYTAEDGLHIEVVNSVLEVGEDSLWVAVNINKMNCLVRGKLSTLATADSFAPITNVLCKTADGTIYSGADDGLFVFAHNKFIKQPFVTKNNTDANSFISLLIPYGRYLLVMRDFGLAAQAPKTLYLYDCKKQKIVAETTGEPVTHAATGKDGRVWVVAGKKIKQLNTTALVKGQLMVEDLPLPWQSFAANTGSLYFDNQDNCWIADGRSTVKKCDRNGAITTYTTASGLQKAEINSIFEDKEGIVWLASVGGGVQKLVHGNFALVEKPFGVTPSWRVVYYTPENDMLLFAQNEKKIFRFTEMDKVTSYDVPDAALFQGLAATPGQLYGIGLNKIFKLTPEGKRLKAVHLFTDTSANSFGSAIADKWGNLLITGQYSITIVKKNLVVQVPYHFMSDNLATDRHGNVWAATRSGHLLRFSTDTSSKTYLTLEDEFIKELQSLSPRSVAVDQYDRIWVGNRFGGLYAFAYQNKKLKQLYHLTARTGLTENFICWLHSDAAGNIWACSPSGLDKIHFENGQPVIENLTRQNNLYSYVSSVTTDAMQTAWALSADGLIRITPGKEKLNSYTPQLMLVKIRAGYEEVSLKISGFEYGQNNLNFYFAAPSFFDEQRILYSYRLQGSSNTEWSIPANNATASLIDLRPGRYTLLVKASFPAGRYPDSHLQYAFYIAPPWWQTTWFMGLAALLATCLVFAGIRSYYRSKLEKQKIALEKQQAIERERTRIATDMHDDLGAGLSRIKFLSETIGIKKQQAQSIEEDIGKIRDYSHEMISKMGEIVWALNEKNDTLSDLLSFTRAYATEYLTQNGIRCKVLMPDDLPDVFVTGEFRRNIFLSVKEALHNVVKHAAANEVTITIETDQRLRITISDDGKGFTPQLLRPFSNGLNNMQQRTKSLGGRAEVIGEDGTTVLLEAPLPR